MTNITLRRHLTEDGLDPNLVYLIEDIAGSCRVVANTVRNEAFEGNLGSADALNVQGETQKTLDIPTNDVFGRICSNSPRLAALVSEEVEEVTWLKDPQAGHGFEGTMDMASLVTDLDEAAEFILLTQVDALAIAIGTSLGAYKFSRKPDGKILAMQALKAIHAKIPNTHLVMHGASSVQQELQDKINACGGKMAPTCGVPVEKIEPGIKYGVRKVNVDKDFRMALPGAIREVFAKSPSEFDPRKYLEQGVAAMSAVCKDRFERFGAAGMASKITSLPLAQMAQRYAAPHLALAS